MNGHPIDIETHRAVHAEMRGNEPARPAPVLTRRADEGDAAFVNAILNDPAVFPQISLPGQEAFDVAPLIADPRNVFLMAEGGVIICIPDLEPTSAIYEIHMNFLPGHRGQHALAAAVDAAAFMFTRTPCMTLVTRVPQFNDGADVAARRVGGRLWFTRHAAWPVADGEPVDVAFYALTLQDFATRHPQAFIDAGRAFHAHLDEEYSRVGFARPDPHPDEDSHDLAVGLAVQMLYGGEPEKALILYNRWARLAGYGQVALVSRNPLVVDMGESLLQVMAAERTFKVILCR